MIENKTSQVTTTEKTPPRLQKLPLDTERTAIYCQEEGVEGLHQSYIKVHGLCRLPRAHKHRHRSISEEENAKHRHNKDCHTNAMNHHSKECIENAKPCHDTVCLEKCHGSLDKPFQHCQKGQYMLVRLPPHCSVRWKRHMDYESRFRRHHSQECRREKLMEVRFS